MKLPNSIKIGPVRYKVQEVEGLKGADDENYFGMVHFSTSRILIEKGLNDTQKAETFLHEIMHVLLEQSGRVDHDEGMIDGLSYGWIGVMCDNPDFKIPLFARSDVGK